MQANEMIKKLFFIIGTLVWLIIAFQYSSNPLVPFDDRLEQEKDFKEIVSTLEKENIFIKGKLEDLRAKVSLLTKTKELAFEDFAKLENEAWLNDVKWLWVQIKLSWNVIASDLRDLINVLREIQVSAISVWEQRVIFSTPIIDLKDVILVWNTRLKSPFSVFVYWDSKRISSWIAASPILSNFLKRNKEKIIQVELVETEVSIPKI